MSDHISGPRAIADPVIDITDVYAFPCPESPQHLVLIMNVFPYAGPSAVFSDAVIYRLRVRPVSIEPDGRKFAVAADESIFNCTFSGTQAQECRCTLPSGDAITFRTNDESGGKGKGVQLFAGQRSDPFFLDGPMAEETITTGQLAFKEVGSRPALRQECLVNRPQDRVGGPAQGGTDVRDSRRNSKRRQTAGALGTRWAAGNQEHKPECEDV